MGPVRVENACLGQAHVPLAGADGDYSYQSCGVVPETTRTTNQRNEKIQMLTTVRDTLGPNVMPKHPRAHRRTLFSVPFHLRPLDAKELSAVRAISLDISEGGIGALVQGKLQVGEEVEIDLPLGEKTLLTPAIVRYTSARRSGFEFLRLNDRARKQISRLVGVAYEAFTSEQNMLRCLPHVSEMLTTRPGNWWCGGLAPHKIHSLVGCSSVMGMFRQLTHSFRLGDPRGNHCVSAQPSFVATFGGQWPERSAARVAPCMAPRRPGAFTRAALNSFNASAGRS